MEELISQTLGRYKIVELLGAGGMEAVFRSRDITLRRDVALKVIHPRLARAVDFQQRFLQKACSACRDREARVRYRRQSYAS